MAEGRRVAELGSPVGQSMIAVSYAAVGNRAEALKALNQLIPRSKQSHSGAERIATVYAVLGDFDSTFVWLEEAYKQHDANLLFLNVFPEFDRLHADLRFQDLVRRLGIPSS